MMNWLRHLAMTKHLSFSNTATKLLKHITGKIKSSWRPTIAEKHWVLWTLHSQNSTLLEFVQQHLKEGTRWMNLNHYIPNSSSINVSLMKSVSLCWSLLTPSSSVSSSSSHSPSFVSSLDTWLSWVLKTSSPKTRIFQKAGLWFLDFWAIRVSGYLLLRAGLERSFYCFNGL